MGKHCLITPQMQKEHSIYPGIFGDINTMGNLLKIFLFNIFIKNGLYNSAGNYLRSL